MPLQNLTGGQALAQGALASGIAMATGYPGSPSTEVLEELARHARALGIHVEWSSNEKVALELGIGASIAGRRALVCTKSVGFNVMLDPLMALCLTPLHGGLVILLGDDPGGYGSQNDQDTRPLATVVEMPLVEPSTPADAFVMMRAAFDASERLQTPIIVRETRSFEQQAGSVEIPGEPFAIRNRGLVREVERYVPVPRNVVAKHRALHERIDEMARWANDSSFNRIEGDGPIGIVAAGFTHAKLRDVLGEALRASLRVLKLAHLFPLPEALMADFLNGCEQVLVLEENEPYVETHLKAIAYDAGARPKILGKRTGHVVREGELYRWQIEEALKRLVPGFVPAQHFDAAHEAAERPQRENYCAGCPFEIVLDAIEQAADGPRPVLIGDPGCMARLAHRIDAKLAMGSAVAVADGLSKVGLAERAVALFGDSSFFHGALPAICNAAVNGSNILLVVLDNGSTVTTGFQPHPGVGVDATGAAAPVLEIEPIARACGVRWIESIGPDRLESELPALFRRALAHPGLALLHVRIRCERKR